MAHAVPTPVDELVIYGIDADTFELLRYSFDADEIKTIGVIVDQNGILIDHPESLTFLPSGPYKGFYSAPTGKDGTGGPSDVLAKIDGLTAQATLYATPFTYEEVRGMTVAYNPIGSSWDLMAVAHDSSNPKLIRISPADSSQQFIMNIDESVLDENVQGIANHPDPNMLYLLTGAELAVLDLIAGTTTKISDHSAYYRTEALEIVFGDDEPAVVIPGVSSS